MGKSGVYGANIHTWPWELWQKFQAGKFDWAIVRTDTSPEVARALAACGRRVIIQATDHFNKSFTDPAEYAKALYYTVDLYREYSNLLVLDNEPNLCVDRASNWWAEHFTRWYRAVAASFRYYDEQFCHWQLVFPGLCGQPDRNFGYWLRINRENIEESEYVGVHAYWLDAAMMDHQDFGGHWKKYHTEYPRKRLLILEYANSNTTAGDREKCVEYPEYISSLPDCVDCACAFILGGTKMWEHFHLTMPQAEALGRLA